MKTTPTPPGSVLYKAIVSGLIFLKATIHPPLRKPEHTKRILSGRLSSMLWMMLFSLITTSSPAQDQTQLFHSILLPDCGGGPCDAQRWSGGAGWDTICPNSGGLIDDGPSANGGIVRCGNSAETQSNIGPNSCYDPNVFTAFIGGQCIDPNTSLPVTLTLPLIDQAVLWFNFDVRAFAGGYDFQVIGGNEDIAWILYYSNTPQNCVGGITPGLSGDCNSLSYYACGTNFGGWAAQPFSTPIFDLTTNVYLLVWDQGFSKGDVSSDDFSINFKARYGCGENCAFATNGAPVITCLPNGSYTVFQNVVGTSTTVTVSAPGSTSIVTNPSPLTFTSVEPGPPPNVNSGTVTVTYPAGVNYNIIFTPSGTGAGCLSDTLMGIAPICCIPPNCTITGPSSVCPGTTNVYCGPGGASEYAWSIGTGGTIIGATNEQCVTVTAASVCATTYTLTLAAGPPSCQSTCMYTVTVSDVSVPTITCPPDITIQCNTNSAPGGGNGTASATDNCSAPADITITSSDVTASGSCPQAYTITRTWRATDACNNSSTCNQIIQVVDTTPPTISCPANVTVSCFNEVPSPDPGSVTSSDNCDPVPNITFVSDVTTGQTCANQYTIARTYRATDGCNNSSTCVQIITVNDQTAPSITCPANVTVSCIGNVPAVNVNTVTSTDNCGGMVTITHVSDNITGTVCANRLTITRIYRATDNCGNSATCAQIITVNDQTPPFISCPPPVTVSCAFEVPAPNPGSVTTSDNCGGTPTVTFVNDVTTSQTCVNRFTLVRTYRATDACGNSATCTQTITVNDVTPPAITCPAPVTVMCASQVPAINTTSVIASDNCNGIPVITHVLDVTTNQTCVNRYTLTRTYRATDECGNSSTCTQVITVNDQTPPTITCPAPLTVSCAGDVPPANTLLVSASDNCGGNVTLASLADVTTNQSCPNRYTITRTYRATDACLMTATCTQIITVFDGTPPTLTCPTGVTVQCASQIPPPNPASVSASDNCSGVPSVTFVSDVTTNPACVNQFLVTRTYRATDACGNSATCTQLITVFDNTIPMITCPGPVTVQCASQVPPPNPGSVTATDNCNGIPTITFVGDLTTNQSCVNRFTVTRTYRATDECGNSATCTQTITVFDDTAPSNSCPVDVTVSCAFEIPPPVTIGLPATDNCNGIPTVSLISDLTTNQSCANRFTVTRVYRAVDECGNSSTCSQVITVNDQTPPTLMCPANVTVACSSFVPPANPNGLPASDNCGGTPIVTFDGDVISNQTCDNRYLITRTFRATDECGNSTTCTQLITVLDQAPPSITCPPNVSVTCASEVPAPNTGEVSASDVCPGDVTISHVGDNIINQLCDNRYTVVRTYRATDECGNSSTCDQLIFVNDQIAPAIMCPIDITVTCTEFIPAPATGSVTVSDNCGGFVSVTFVGDTPTSQVCANDYIMVRTYRATDACGNSATCNQLIRVLDQTPPTLQCPAPITVTCASQVPAPNNESVTTSDNCQAPVDVVHVGDDISNQVCANRYTLTRTYRAIDACNNSATCVQIINVFDDVPPQIVCPPDATINTETSTLPASTGTATATDNCGESPSLTYSDVTTTGACIEEYTINRTWIATDACLNTATCLQVIEITGGCIVDLALDKELAAGQSPYFVPGDNVSFTIRVTNNGNVTISSVEVTDYIPIGFTLNDSDWTAGTEGSTGQSASIILSIGNGLLPPGGLVGGAFVDVDITLQSDINLAGGSYVNIAEISEVINIEGIDVTDQDIDSQPDTDDTNDLADEDDHDPLIICAIIDPVIIGDAIVCQNETSVYTVENYNPEHTYNWEVGDGGIIVEATDSSITVLWIADAGTLVTITLTEIAGEGCEFVTVFDVIIGGAEALACIDHINLSIGNACGTQILSGMILTGDQAGDNSYEVYVIDMTTGDTIPNAIVDCSHLGITFKVSVRSPCTGQSCWGLVTIEDKAPPILECSCSEPTTEENCELSCMIVDQILLGNIPEEVQPVIVDDCCGSTLELTNVELDFADCTDGSVVLTWLATDGMGNTATCSQEFDIAPLDISTIVWPADYLGDCDDSDDPSNTGYPTLDGLNLLGVAQSCNIWTQYDDQVIPICGDGRKIIRRWTITNMCNAQSLVHIQVILLKDRVGPVLTCAPDITIGTDLWACYATVLMPLPGAVDACSSVRSYQLFSTGGLVVESNGQWRIANLPMGTHVARWVVTDECWNTSECLIEITVVDNVPPVVACQHHTVASLTSERPNGVTLIPAESLNDGSFDNCTALTFRARRMDSCIDFDWTTGGACVDDIPGNGVNAFDLGTAYAPCFPVACCDVGDTIMVQLEVSDEFGNVNSCMVEVYIQDKLSPDLICPPTIILSCDYPLEIQEGTFRDNLGNQNGNLDEDPLSELFGNMYDAFHYQQSARQHIIINDPNSDILPQPHDWGLEGWAVDNCEVDLSVTVVVREDCSGNSFPSNHPEGAVKLIERRFLANDGVQSGSCVQRIWIVDYNPFFITDSTCSNENPFDGVIWPCDVTVNNCPMEITNTGEPIIFEDACSLIGVSYEDSQFNFDDEACFKILREWKILDWCQFDPNTGYGLWTYTQTIKVADNVGAEFLTCPSAPVELCTTDPGISLPDNNQLFLGENNPNSTNCTVHVIMEHTIRELCSSSVTYDVKYFPFNDPDFIQIKPETTIDLDANHEGVIYFNTEESNIISIAQEGLPYNSPLCGDYHRILWTVEDGCGNRTFCDYLFRLEDCKPPTPVCHDGISTVVMSPQGEVTVFADIFDASSVDDCTPSDELLFSFSGTSYQPSFVYTCDNVPVLNEPFDEEIWVADGGSDDNCNGIIEWSERNIDFCVASLMITDPNDVCDENGLVLVGEIMTEQTEAVSQVTVNLTGPLGSRPPYVTLDDGKYTFGNVQEGLNYTIEPKRNDDPKNGVSTLDLVQIQKHLLGIAPFNSGYQYIAGDANNSASVTAIDLIEIRKVILGVYDEFPNNQSWRFVEKEESTNPGPPWPITESISIFNLQVEDVNDLDFIGIKIGDVNHSAKAHFSQVTPRNGNRVVTIKASTEKELSAGSTVECKITIPELVEGFQWTLQTTGLVFEGIRSTSIPIDDSHVGVLDNGIVTMSWNGEPTNSQSTSISFIVKFRVTTEGTLDEMIKLINHPTNAEAYTPEGEVLDVKLDIDNSQPFVDFALYQNKPNPWEGHTLIEFDLPYDGPAVLTIYDVAGKVIKMIEGQYKAGHHAVMITSADIPTPGVLYYRLDSGAFSGVKKMMILD